jgi:hypothetical protein
MKNSSPVRGLYFRFGQGDKEDFNALFTIWFSDNRPRPGCALPFTALRLDQEPAKSGTSPQESKEISVPQGNGFEFLLG